MGEGSELMPLWEREGNVRGATRSEREQCVGYNVWVQVQLVFAVVNKHRSASNCDRLLASSSCVRPQHYFAGGTLRFCSAGGGAAYWMLDGPGST